MPTPAQNEAYWRDKLKGQGDVRATPPPDTWAGRKYQNLEDTIWHAYRALGASEPNARQRAQDVAAPVNSVIEGVGGLQAAERAGRNIVQGHGGLGDALDVALIPGLDSLAVKYGARPILEAVGRAAAPIVRHVPEALADAGRAIKDAVFGRHAPEGATPRGHIPDPAPQLTPREAGAQQHIPVPAFQRVHPGSPYVSKIEGPFLHIKREGARPLIVPQARGADIETQRALLADPANNQPLQIADAYNQENFGRGYDTSPPDPGTSLRKQSGIARAFQMAAEGSPEYKHALFEQYGQRMPDVIEGAKAQNYDDLARASYQQLGKETDRQFGTIPLGMRYHYGEGEYTKPSEMFSDMHGNGQLNVFRGGDPHPYLGDVDPDTGLTTNEKFRAVHDYFGHGIQGNTFRPGGEEVAYASHSQMMSPLAKMALLSETRGQNSLVNYGTINADLMHNMKSVQAQIAELRRGDRMRGQRGASEGEIAPLNAQLRELGGQIQYAPQTPLLLPPEYLSPMTSGGVPDWLQAINQPKFPSAPERAVHLSHTPGLTATDPAMYGTGHHGDDWGVRGRAGSPENKTSFYLGDGVSPERMVESISPHAYQTQLSGLYDISKDPEQLVKLAQAYNLGKPLINGKVAPHVPDLVRMAREYGYSGIRNPNFMGSQGAADVFDPVGGLESIVRGPNGYAEGGYVE